MECVREGKPYKVWVPTLRNTVAVAVTAQDLRILFQQRNRNIILIGVAVPNSLDFESFQL